VIFIIALTLTMLTPHLGGLRVMRLKTEVRRLAGRISYVSDQAASNKLVVRITFDLDHNRYFVSQLDPYSPLPMFVADSQPGAAPIALHPGIRLRDVTVANVGTASRGTISCNFYPEGYGDATMIHIDDEWGDIFSVAIDPLTARVSIARGEYDLTANRGARRR
jgi:hypothetical protein